MTTYQRLAYIRKADNFDDTLSAASIAGIESSAVDQEDFQTGYLSQIKRIVGGTDWYTAVQSAASDPRNLKTITDDIYFKRILRRRSVLPDVTVGAGNNFVVLSFASSETPSETAAVGAGSANGAVVALLAGASGSHSLNEVAGLNAITPKNLVIVRDASTFDPILSSGREIYGLLQAESVVVDGDAFDDATKQAQISFVRQTSGGDDLEAVPFADIQNKVINYSYVSRTQNYLLNEQDFLVQTFQDPQTATAATTLQEAYVAGNSIDVLTAEGHLIFNLSQDLTKFQLQRATGVNFAEWLRDDTNGDKLTLDLDILDVNTTTDSDFNQGIKADTGGTTINVGVTAGQIDATALTVKSTTGDLTLYGTDDVLFRTVRETTAFPLDDATAGAISALPGGPYASVSAAIRAALLSADLNIYTQVLQASYAQDANVPGSGNGNAQDWSPALSFVGKSIDMNSPTGVDTIIFYNGSLLFGGNGTTNNDVYVGTTAANGDLKYDFSKGVKSGDTILAVSWNAS